MRKHFFSLFATLLFAYIGVFAQSPSSEGFNSYINDPYINIVPPTPNGASFAQYGNTPVKTSSGLPSISIPIYTIEVDGVKVPITINYDASGMRVDDVSSTVGMKWSLNAGGAVVRTVNDKDDFTNQTNSPYGWIWGNGLSRFDDYINGIDPSQDYSNTDFQILYQDRITRDDNFPDDFSYNFLNFSGKFMFKPNGQVLKGKHDGLKIDGAFDMVDLMGNIYGFHDSEYNTFKTRQLQYTYPSVSEIEWDNYVVGWFLTTIETKNKKYINFSYEHYQGYEYSISPASQSIVTAQYCGESCSFNQPPNCIGYDGPSWKSHNVFMGTEVFYDTSTSLVNKIYTDNTEVEFVYSEGSIANADGSSTTVSGWSKRIDKIIIKDKLQEKQKEFVFKYGVFNGDARLKLTEIQEKGFDGTPKPPYKFYYDPTYLPEMGSKSKDFKGYYNGKTNPSLMPFSTKFLEYDYGYNLNMLGDRFYDDENLKAGVLTKIEYPTGGTTEFEYEVNALGNSSEPETKSKGIFITNYDNGNVQIYGDGTPNIYFGYNKYIYSTLVEINDPFEGFNIQNAGDCVNCSCDCPQVSRLILYKYNGNITDSPEDYFNPGNIDNPPVPVLTTTFTENGNQHVSFDSSQGNGVYIAMLLIGSRIPYAYDYDPEEDQVQVSINWYEKERDGNGNILFKKNYFGGLRVKEIMDYDIDASQYNHKRYSYLEAYLDGSGITYSIDDFRQNLANQTTFYSNPVPAYYGRPLNGYAYTKIRTENLVNNSLRGGTIDVYDVNFDFNTVKGGDLLQRIIFDKEEKILEITENDYVSEVSDSLSFHKPTYLGWNGDDYYELTEICQFGGVPIYKPAFNEYTPHTEYSEIKKTLSVSRLTKLLSQNGIKEPATTTIYDYNDNVLVTQETTDTRYTASVANGVITDYVLDNPTGEVIESNYKYVDDPTINPPLTNLPVGLPISMELFNSGKQISGQYFEYDDIGNIKNTYRYNKGGGSHSGPSYVPPNYELDATYLTEEGKPTQVRGSDGIYVSYLWGYGKQYPIARIVNATNDGIASALGISIQALLSYNESNLSQLNSLRALMPSAQVTTYTYSPMIGVTSITDPKGVQIEYIYDDFGRLEYVRDQENNILGKNEYRYKN